MDGLNSGVEEIHVANAKNLFAHPAESFLRLNG